MCGGGYLSVCDCVRTRVRVLAVGTRGAEPLTQLQLFFRTTASGGSLHFPFSILHARSLPVTHARTQERKDIAGSHIFHTFTLQYCDKWDGLHMEFLPYAGLLLILSHLMSLSMSVHQVCGCV